jgi:aspartate aminotransferase
LEAAITPQTRVFLFSSPCNPSGAVYNEKELEALVRVFEKYPDITIISDEIYEYINFVGNHLSIASFPSVVDRVAIVNGLSKGFAMTGWRVGYIAASETIAKACEKIQGQFTSGTNSIAQRAAIAALREDLRPTQEMVKEFAARRELVLQLVSKIPGIQCPSPEGAFYIFPDIRAYFGRWDGEQQIKNAADLSMFLLHKAHVSSVMGDAFGEPNCIRFSFANSREKIKEGWARIQQALGSLRDA